jgi:hypothetical protein
MSTPDQTVGHEDHDEGYGGAATVLIGNVEVAVRAELRGHFQPIDGHFHWYGRLAASPELDQRVKGSRAQVVLRTPEGESVAELSDQDAWGRYRVAGQGAPPFALDPVPEMDD